MSDFDGGQTTLAARFSPQWARRQFGGMYIAVH